MPLSLLSLFLASFCIGTTEFMIAGLLPEISSDLGVSIPVTGILISGYAIGVAIGGPIMGLLLTPLQRKQAVLILMGIFVLGHLWCAAAPSYGLLLAGRIVISLSHGAFFGIAVIIASTLVPPDRSGRAVAVIGAAITIANVVGVPGGTLIGQTLGWRAVFLVLAALAVLSAAVTTVLLPANRSDRAKAPRFKAQVRALGNQKVFLTFLVIIFEMIGFWSVFTFVAPLLISTSNVSDALVPGLLLLFGVGATVGTLIGGRFADMAPTRLLLLIFPLQAVAFTLVIVASSVLASALALFVLGMTIFAPQAPLVNRLLSGAAAAPELASTLLSTVFNIGIASGALIGASALEGGLDYGQLPWIGLMFAGVTTATMMFSLRLDQHAAVHRNSQAAIE
jgi:MFS transporter, DHA1 family, inner membrane transport protein